MAVFEHVYANAFYTTASHMTVFTSLYPHQHQVSGTKIHFPGGRGLEGPATPLDPKYKTLAEVLRSSGYRTVWAGPQRLKHLDFSLGFNRGFATTEPSLFERTIRFADHLKESFHDRRLEELVKGKKPYFLFLHSYVTHLPYFVDHAKLSLLNKNKVVDEFLSEMGKDPGSMIRPIGYDAWPAEVAKLCSDRRRLPQCFKKYISENSFVHGLGQFQMRNAKDLSNDQIAEFREGYNNSVRELDEDIGKLWATLERTNALKNTIVIFFSDHGEELFEHARAGHSTFFEHSSRALMAIYHPRIQKEQRISELVSLIDIMPTALHALNIDGPKSQMKGQSLTEPRKRNFAYGYSIGVDFITDGNWKLIRDYDGFESLYYLPTDPAELKSLIDLSMPPVNSAYKRLVNERRTVSF
jgi:arylsulfatase A-like enzyme